MVGRARELRQLASVWERATSERACQLFTVLGAAGVGKSRLSAEFLASLDDILVVRGRCLPYGEGITYWPVVEVLKQLPAADVDPAAAETIEALLGNQKLVTSSEEIAWAFRKQLEAVARERPLVCMFDDLHWGEATFLDLVEHVADLSRGAPILLLCMARPDLLDRRTGWGGGKVNATTVLLEPLAPAETALLIESLAQLDERLRARVQDAAEGNPLFVEEMVALLQESGDDEVDRHRRFRRCSRLASTSSTRASEASSSVARSKGERFIRERCGADPGGDRTDIPPDGARSQGADSPGDRRFRSEEAFASAIC